jgi:prepilin-type processing-associated H-X9-DG protein
VQDANNLRQLGIGMVAYLNDNDDQMFAVTPTGSGWPATLQVKYVPSWKSFQSPFDKGVRNSGLPVSYGINKNVMTPATTATGTSWTGNMGSVKSSTSTIMMAPNFNMALGPSDANAWNETDSGNSQITPPTAKASGMGTHSNRNMINALFCDSHVEALKSIDFTDSTSTGIGDKRWDPSK